MVNVKIKRLVAHAEIPEYGRQGDAGLDLVATDVCHDRDYDFIEFGTGIAVEIPPGYVGLLFPRSSISKTPHQLANSVGVVDSNYRGEIKLRFKTKEGREYQEYSVGDKIGQLIIIPYPTIVLQEVEQLSDTNRGSAGFGSSGK